MLKALLILCIIVLASCGESTETRPQYSKAEVDSLNRIDSIKKLNKPLPQMPYWP